MCIDIACPRQIEYLTQLYKANNQPVSKDEELEIERLLANTNA